MAQPQVSVVSCIVAMVSTLCVQAGCSGRSPGQQPVQGEVTSKVDNGRMQIFVDLPGLSEVSDFRLDDWSIVAGSVAVHARPTLWHGTMKGGHGVSFAIGEDSIPGNLQEVTCSFQFSLDEQRMRVTGSFRKDGQGHWTGVQESLKLEPL